MIWVLALRFRETVDALVVVANVAVQLHDLLLGAADAAGVASLICWEIWVLCHVRNELSQLDIGEGGVGLHDLADIAQDPEIGQRGA